MLEQIFDYMDKVFAKMTRIWMYALEIAGMSFVFVRTQMHDKAAQLILEAKTTQDVTKYTEYYKSITQTTSDMAPIIIMLCVIMPAVIATLRTVRKKWSIKTPLGEMCQEFGDEKNA